MKRSVNREFEDVMTMVREVIMHQYEQSPNAVAFFRSQGVGSRIDPLLRLTEICTPDSLDHVCSVFEAYRNMVFHIMKQGWLQKRNHILLTRKCAHTNVMKQGWLQKRNHILLTRKCAHTHTHTHTNTHNMLVAVSSC
jgi:hypothetical protein